MSNFNFMTRILFFGLLAMLFLTECQRSSSGKKIEEIRTDGASNADIIRNPVSAEGPQDTVNIAKITFKETEYHFGEVFKGDIVRHVFEFTNTGKVPLLINDARATCGCTVPIWPREPIAPGQSSQIEVRFNTENKHGGQNKAVTITANTYPATSQIHLIGKVLDSQTENQQ